MDTFQPATPRVVPSRRIVVAGLSFSLVLTAILCELGLQAYVALLLRPEWKMLQSSESYLYQKTDNPVLGYELKRNYEFDDGTRRVVLNAQGIRNTGSPATQDEWTIAFVGDSVTFGQGLDENDLFTAILQQEFRRDLRAINVLNFGVPGYDVADVAENLRVKDSHYQADAFYYLLNLNDYARKHTRFEGADNGLYRMHRMPLLKTPMFIRKVVFRWHKQGKMATPDWYRWMVYGNLDWAEKEIQQMADYARTRQRLFTVLILPGGCAYEPDGYRLQDVHDRIALGLRRRAIAVVDLAAFLSARHAEWFDKTDHLTPSGNRALARTLAPLILTVRPESKRSPAFAIRHDLR